MNSCIELLLLLRQLRRSDADRCCLFLFLVSCPSVLLDHWHSSTSLSAGSPLSGLVACCVSRSFDFVMSPQSDFFFYLSVVSCFFLCARYHCDCCLLFLFLLLPAVMIQGWVFYTVPTSISPINELWQTTFPFSVCDILNEQPLSVITF